MTSRSCQSFVRLHRMHFIEPYTQCPSQFHRIPGCKGHEEALDRFGEQLSPRPLTSVPVGSRLWFSEIIGKHIFPAHGEKYKSGDDLRLEMVDLPIRRGVFHDEDFSRSEQISIKSAVLLLPYADDTRSDSQSHQQRLAADLRTEKTSSSDTAPHGSPRTGARENTSQSRDKSRGQVLSRTGVDSIPPTSTQRSSSGTTVTSTTHRATVSGTAELPLRVPRNVTSENLRTPGRTVQRGQRNGHV